MRPVILLLALWACASAAQQMLPGCGPRYDGQVSASGCRCRHWQASQLSAQPAGWRWSCDLLREGPPPPATIEQSDEAVDSPHGY